MPTYEYACTACGHQFEEFQSITSKPLTVCPSCKKKKVKRLVSGGAGFLFKGSGFYTTDYRSESYKAAAKSDTAAPAAPAGGSASTPATTAPAKSETKSESKPAAKTSK